MTFGEIEMDDDDEDGRTGTRFSQRLAIFFADDDAAPREDSGGGYQDTNQGPIQRIGRLSLLHWHCIALHCTCKLKGVPYRNSHGADAARPGWWRSRLEFTLCVRSRNSGGDVQVDRGPEHSAAGVIGISMNATRTIDAYI